MANYKGGYIILDLTKYDLSNEVTLEDEELIEFIRESYKLNKPYLIKCKASSFSQSGSTYNNIIVTTLAALFISDELKQIISLVFYRAGNRYINITDQNNIITLKLGQ